MSSPTGRIVSAAFATVAVVAVGVTFAVSGEYLLSVPVVDALQGIGLLGAGWRDGHTATVALWCVALTLPPAVYLSRGFFRHALRIEQAVDRGEL